ncbi:MAG: hypothetical protein GY696_15640 [Gammaproteobacteria bacterium]|nr:hypothetical protein [Gammaproteobacteria bacterium]
MNQLSDFVHNAITRINADFQTNHLYRISQLPPLPKPQELVNKELPRSNSVGDLTWDFGFGAWNETELAEHLSEERGDGLIAEGPPGPSTNGDYESRSFRHQLQNIYKHSAEEAKKHAVWVEYLDQTKFATYKFFQQTKEESTWLYRCIESLLATLTNFGLEMPPKKQGRRVGAFTGKANEDYDQWFCRFELMLKADSITDDEMKVAILPTFFDDNAFDFYLSLSPTTRKSWGLLTAALKNRYHLPEQKTFTAIQLANRRQLPGESVTDFEADIRKLGKSAYPDVTEIERNKLLYSAFVHGIHPRLRNIILAQNDMTSMDDALSYALKIEKIGGLGGQTTTTGGKTRALVPAEGMLNVAARALTTNNVEPPSTDITVMEKMSKSLKLLTASSARVEATLSEHDKIHKSTNERLDGYETMVSQRMDQQDAAIGTLGRRIDGLAKSIGLRPLQKGKPLPPNRWWDAPKTIEVCWNCEQVGHLSRDCPLPLATSHRTNPKQEMGAPPMVYQREKPLDSILARGISQDTGSMDSGVDYENPLEGEEEIPDETEEVEEPRVIIGTVTREDRIKRPPVLVHRTTTPRGKSSIYEHFSGKRSTMGKGVNKNSKSPHSGTSHRGRKESKSISETEDNAIPRGSPSRAASSSKLINLCMIIMSCLRIQSGSETISRRKGRRSDLRTIKIQHPKQGIWQKLAFWPLFYAFVIKTCNFLDEKFDFFKKHCFCLLLGHRLHMLCETCYEKRAQYVAEQKSEHPDSIKHRKMEKLYHFWSLFMWSVFGKHTFLGHICQMLYELKRKCELLERDARSFAHVGFDFGECKITRRITGILWECGYTICAHPRAFCKILIFLSVLSARVQSTQVDPLKIETEESEVPSTGGPNPMVCGTTTIKDFWKLPKQMPCKVTPLQSWVIPRVTKVRLYKYNFIEYKAKAWHCTKVRTQNRVWSTFLGTKFYKEHDVQTCFVSKRECMKMIKKNHCDISDNARLENTWNDESFDPKYFSETLLENQNGWQTANTIPDYKPWGGRWCCHWHRRTVENCYNHPTFVYKKFDSPEILSPKGDMEHCKYDSRGCNLPDGSYLKWEASPKSECRFVPWKEVTGVRWGRNFLASDQSIGLTFGSAEFKPFPGCNQEELFLSDQSIAMEILESKNWLHDLPALIPFREARTNDSHLLQTLEDLSKGVIPELPENAFHEDMSTVYSIYRKKNMRDASPLRGGEKQNILTTLALNSTQMKDAFTRLDEIDKFLLKETPEFWYDASYGTNRLRKSTVISRGIRDNHRRLPSQVTSDHLAGVLQGVWITLEEHLKFSFEQAMQTTCNNVNIMVKLLYSQVMEQPTLAMRQIFNTEYILARAGGDVVEIIPCHEIPYENVHFLPMESGLCTQDIPVMYLIPELGLEWQEGYLNPLTKNIQRHSLEIDCELVNVIPLQFGTKYFAYRSAFARLQEVASLPEIGKFLPNSTTRFRIEPHLLRRMKVYNQSNFESRLTMNQLLRAASQGFQIFGQHGFKPRRYNETISVTGFWTRSNIPAHNSWSIMPFTGYVRNLAELGYRIWVLVVVSLVTLGWLSTFCLPGEVSQQLNMRTLVSKLKEELKNEKQRRTKRKLAVADGRALELIQLANKTFVEIDHLPNPGEVDVEASRREVAGIEFRYKDTSPSETFEKLTEVIQRLQDKLLTTQNVTHQRSLEMGVTAAKRQILALTMDVCSGAVKENFPPKENRVDTVLCITEGDRPVCSAYDQVANRLANAPKESIIVTNNKRVSIPAQGIAKGNPRLPEELRVVREVGVIFNDTNGLPPPLSMFLKAQIPNSKFDLVMLWDTGAQVSLIPLDAVERLGLERKIVETPVKASGVGGSALGLGGRIKLTLEFPNFTLYPKKDERWHKHLHIEHFFEVTTNPAVKSAYLGYDFGALFHKWEVDHIKQRVVFSWSPQVPAPLKTMAKSCPFIGTPASKRELKALKRVTINVPMHEANPVLGGMKVKTQVEIPARSVMHISCELTDLQKSSKADLIFEPDNVFEDDHQVVITRQFFTRKAIKQNKLDKKREIHILVCNNNDRKVTLQKGVPLGGLTAASVAEPEATRRIQQIVANSSATLNMSGEKPTPLTTEEKAKILKDLGFKLPEVDLDR